MGPLQKNAEETSLDAQNPQAELETLRKKITALYIGGNHAACAKFIEDNLKTLYGLERWPEEFFSVLRTYQRCFVALGKTGMLEERLTALLEKDGVPFVLALLLRISDTSIQWNTGYFKNLALQAERRDDFETALSYCDLIIKLDPANSSSYVTRGWILDDLKRHNEAVEMFEQAIELNETNHSARNSLAKHYATSNPQLALEHIERAIELSPAEGSYYDTKGRILVRLGDRDGAITCYDAAMSHSPYAADYPYQKGEILLSMGKEIAAIAQYRKAMALDGEHIPTLWRLATLYMGSQPELALTYLNTILSHSPDNTNAQVMRGALLGTLGKSEEAETQFKELLAANPKHPDVLSGYANLILQSNPAEAVVYYDKAIAIEPKNSEYHMGKARALELLEKDAAAIKEYRQVVALDKTNARAFARLGSLLSDSKPREAAGFYAEAARISPDNAFYHAARGEILMRYAESRDEAIACFNMASKHDPQNAQLHVALGGLLEQAGNLVSAVEHYKKAVNLDTDDPEAFYRLAKLVSDSEPEISLLHINRAISLDDKNSDYYFFKSKILTALGHDKHALNILYDSLRADPKNTGALAEISELLQSESPELAIRYMNRAIDLAPSNQDFLCARGRLYFDSGLYKNALSQFEDALRRDSKNVDAIYGIGQCFSLNGDDRALTFFDRAISLDAKNVPAHLEKARFLAAKNQRDAAVSAFDEVIALDPESWEAMLGKAKLLDASAASAEACVLYKAALKLNPDCKDAISRLGILLAELSPRESIEYLDHAIDLSPSEYIYHAWKARALAALGNPEAAATEYHKAARLGGETAETYISLASILRGSKPETALGYCLRAIETDPANAEYQLLCGKIYLELGQSDAAADKFKTALELDHGYHEAFETLAEFFYGRCDPDALKTVDAGLAVKPDCAECILLKVKILDEQTENANTNELIAHLDSALKINPKLTEAQKKLVGLLAKKRSFVRLALEKRKLERMR